jgi:hypothetical protein
MGVVAVGALALGVSALAAPRPVDDSAVRGTNKGKTEVTRLVTGDPAQIEAVVAGAPPSAILAITPVISPLGPYPATTTITGNTLSTEYSGGFLAFFNVQLSNWDPNCDGTPPLKVYQIKMDCIGDGSTKGFVNGKAGAAPLDNPHIPCSLDAAGNTLCRAAFGEDWTKCELGYTGVNECKAGYNDKGGTKRPADNWCAPDGCDAGDVATGINCNFNYFSVYSATRTDDCTGPPRKIWYGGTLVLQIAGKDPGPPAKGKYCVNLLPDETFIADTAAPPNDIPTAQENGFCVDIVQGSCCHDLGTPLAGCTNDTLHNECDGANDVWTKGGSCQNPPTADGCAACTVAGRNTDPRCSDGDACTDDDCAFPPGICSHKQIAGWDQLAECCEGGGATAVVTTLNDNDLCTTDKCVNATPTPAPALENGTATHNLNTVPCDDQNLCTFPSACDGIHTEAQGGCVGHLIVGDACLSDADCQNGGQTPPGLCDLSTGTCTCSLVPNVQFVLSPSAPKTCVGGFNDGGPCSTNADCPGIGAYCNNFAGGANCFDPGDKITALVHIGSAGTINGGEFLMTYDPTCVKYVSATCMSPYSTTVYGPVVNAAAGTIFIACGVDPFANVNGPLGNVDIVSLSFTKIGECDNCELCFADNNPLHSYLVDDEGQAVNIEGKCKELSGKGKLVLDVPDNIKTNVDCDKPTAAETWASPTATFSCGPASLSCRGVHESGLSYGKNTALVMGGGVFPQGASSFCCYAVGEDKCATTAGCPGAANDCATGPSGKPEGCWTVQVNDETSMDIDIGLEPPTTTTNRDGTLTRCVEFCLYANCIEEPLCFEDDVTFGGLFQFTGKSQGKIKIPGKGQWDCITAQDQLHSLRSCCDSLSGCLHCNGSQLVADFTGDPALGGNWLIGGNLDAFKKDVVKASHNIIDILDYGMFVWQFGVCYADKSPGCHDGPHADINGDGCVGIADYNFIIKNFLLSSKDCCCVGSAAAATPLAEVSVDELRQMGMGELAVADLNGDGLVNAQDMDAFMQGARPTKTSNDRKGGKGLRSGR